MRRIGLNIIKPVLLGGNIMVPINEKDNQEVTELATKYFKTCEAKSRGGRIAWIGLTSNSSTEWKVSKHYYKFNNNFIDIIIIITCYTIFLLQKCKYRIRKNFH